MRLSDKDDNASKTMNTHLHIIEPYTNLLRVWPDAGLLKATKSLLEIFLDRIGNPEYRGHMGLFFDNDWQRLDSEISYGHDIEASWLLLETAQVINGVENNPELLKRTLESTHRMADAALEGRCADGSMVYERHGNGRYDNDKHWWVQAEAVVGQLWQYSFHKRPEMLPAAFETWGYIRDNLVSSRRMVLEPQGWRGQPQGRQGRLLEVSLPQHPHGPGGYRTAEVNQSSGRLSPG